MEGYTQHYNFIEWKYGSQNWEQVGKPKARNLKDILVSFIYKNKIIIYYMGKILKVIYKAVFLWSIVLISILGYIISECTFAEPCILGNTNEVVKGSPSPLPPQILDASNDFGSACKYLNKW